MAAAGIPKTMNIVPQIVRVNDFVSGTNKVQKSVDRMVKGVNRSLNSLRSSSTALGGTSSTIDKVNRSISGNLSVLNRWASGFNAMNNPLTRFGSTISRIGVGITRLSFQLERMGRGMLVAFTLPAVAAGIAITKTAIDWENALVKVENLVGVSRAKVAAWGREILDFSTDLAVLPVEAARGLFAAASGFGEIAGQKPVMDVLVSSIMAMNIGLGETEDIARATTAMMNTFADANLSASQATSLLVLGVREGNLEVDKLSTALGNVLGVASFIRAGADDVLAFIAAYTRFGVVPTRAVTALNTALTNLVKPSKQNREILEKYGLTLETIREKIAGPAGLANLFIEMEQNMAELDFISIFGLRSLRGVAAVTNSIAGFNKEYMRIAENMQAETGRTFTFMAKMAEKGSKEQKRFLKEAIDASETGMNALEESFVRTMDTLGYKFNQIKSLFQQTFLGVDSAIAPFLKDFADRIIAALESVKEFIETNKESVKLIVKLVAALALAGPALIIFSRVFQSFGVMLSLIGGVLTTLGSAVGIVVNLGVKLGVLAVNVGVRGVQAFLLFGRAIYFAVASMVAFSLSIARVIVMNLGMFLIGIVGAATSAGSAIASLGVAFIGATAAAGPWIAGIIAIIAAASAIGAAVLLITGAIQSLGESIGDAFDEILDFFAPVKQAFEDLAPEGKSWGQGLIAEFSKGIYDGLIYLVDALNAVGEVIAYWLKGLSPPRIAPDIDIWGQKTMQEWIDGWLKADFGVFNTIQSTIESFLKSLADSVGKEDQEGAIAKILLGSRGAIAEAINQIREFGEATQETLDKIYTAIGSTTAELQNYIEATLAAAATTDALADAQQRVNDINEKYSALLDPIQAQLKEIDRQRQGISDDRELEHLNRLLERGNLPEQVADLARIRIQEIELQKQQTGLEGQRDAELSVAEKQLKAAEDTNDAAQRRLEFAQEALGLQTRGLDLLAQMIKKLDDIKDKIEKAPKKIADAIAEAIEMEPVDFGDSTGGFDFDPDGDGDGEDGPLSQLDAKLEELTKKLEETKRIWGEVFTEMFGAIQTWYNKSKKRLNIFMHKIDFVWGPAWRRLKTEGAKVWKHLTEVLNKFWENTADTREMFGRWLGGLIIIFSGQLPDKITTFADALHVIIDALDIFLTWVGSADDPISNFVKNMTILSIALGPLSIALANYTLAVEAYERLKLASDDEGTDNKFILWLDEMKTAWDETVILLGSIIEDINALALDFKTAIDNFFSPLGPGEESSESATIGGMLFQAYEGSALQTNISSFFDAVGIDIANGWETAITPPDEESKKGTIYDPFGDFEGSLFQKNLGSFMDAAGKFLSTAWKNATSPPEESVPLFDLFSKEETDGVVKNIGNVSTASVGLGTGFFTLGTKTDIARLAAESLRTKVIELKDQALEVLRLKVESLRLKMEDWRAKMVRVNTWVGNLKTKVDLFITTSLTNLSNFITDTLNIALEDARQLFQDIQEWIDEKTEPAILAINEAFDAMSKALDPMNTLLSAAADLLEKVWDWAMKLPDWIVNWIKGGMPSAPKSAEPEEEDEEEKDEDAQEFKVLGPDIPKRIVDKIPSIPNVDRPNGTRRVSTVATGTGAAIATRGSVAITFGNVIISNDMDMATFEARVRNIVAGSMTN